MYVCFQKNVEVIQTNPVKKQVSKSSNGRKNSGERAEKQMVGDVTYSGQFLCFIKDYATLLLFQNENLNLKSSVDALDLEIEADGKTACVYTYGFNCIYSYECMY